eukprot:TRINITY_DN17094_c0_g1_i1.p1 TRINITY_DN17094_c0_g1~~TRINITY_DN17094_c0_g1_i1.p1  ORF type:complete len:314 (-),score=46.45 TRINITY_DN17094_c0_g1_i1:27-968(-)
MGTRAEVKVGGIVLASLLHLLQGRPGDEEGLLIGEWTTVQQRQKGDHDQADSVTTTHVLEVRAFLPLGAVATFYGPTGAVLPERLAGYLDGSHGPIVGWLRFRRNSVHRVAVRETAVTRALVGSLPGRPPVFALVTVQTSGSRATVNTAVSFHAWGVRGLRNLPLIISNTGAGAQLEYTDFDSLTRSPALDQLPGQDAGHTVWARNARAAAASCDEYFQKSTEHLQRLADEALAEMLLVREQETTNNKLRQRLQQRQQERKHLQQLQGMQQRRHAPPRDAKQKEKEIPTEPLCPAVPVPAEFTEISSNEAAKG